MSNGQLALQFLFQLAIILIACRAVGGLMPRIGQPKVIGEMIAGILLAHRCSACSRRPCRRRCFPPESRGAAVGREPGRPRALHVRRRHAPAHELHQAGVPRRLLISLAGVVLPFLLGAALASCLYADGRFFTANVSNWQSMMYLGRRDVGDGVPCACPHHPGTRHRRDGARHAGAGGRIRR